MKIAVIDIETTGFLKDGGLILEVGIAELNLETGEVVPIYEELVKESTFSMEHYDSWIFKNSSLTWREINILGKPLDTQTIQKIIDKYPCTAYNKSFDFDFLRNRGLVINKELPCPMLALTDVMKLPGNYGYKWPKVTEAHAYLFPNKKYFEEHRGCSDAVDEAKIIHEMYKRGLYKVEI